MFDKWCTSCTGETLEISQEMNSQNDLQTEAETTTTIMLDKSDTSADKRDHNNRCKSIKKKFNPHYARTAAFIVTSSIYGQLLVVICLAFFTAEIVTLKIPLHYFEGFYLYLYSVSLLFLLYVYIYLLSDVPKYEANRLKPSNGKKTQKTGETDRSHASIFLRIGGIVFGLGVMVYNGLEFGAYFEIPYNSPCYSILLGVNPILQAAFTFAQMYFIFTYSRLMIHKFKLIARLGLMHLVATNCCVWIRTLGKETLHELKNSGSSHAFLEELILPLRNQITRSKSRSIHDNYSEVSDSIVNTTTTPLSTTINRSNPCQKENIMGTILSDASPYLYPFIVEYSLIGAAFLYVMWSTIGRGKRNNLCNGNDNSSTPTSPISSPGLQIDNLSTSSGQTYSTTTPALYSCLGSSKGLFSGFLFLAVSVTALIIFFVLVHNPNYKLMATLISDISHSALLILSCIAILLGFIKTRRLKFQPADGGLRDLLLRVAAFGLYIYSFFGVIAGAMELNSVQHLLVLATSALTILQVTLQSLFISDVVCRKRSSQKQPGRQLITFLLINNLTLWIIYTFEMQKVEASPLQLSVYGYTTWALIIRITLPLSIFYRFHSAITFAEVWKNSYKY
ncbi:proton channel OtopLc-like [Oppia nitens]|uniref:proton channel OtopLc-like n=1 Tax=Oppia nitens TaxID=1686743 RepID=UPI0023DC64B9|nr:proton channel OtopLc-like [Oppia nitens]